MGNLNCSNLTIDTQNEIKSADFNRNKTYISKNHILKISSPIRNMQKSKTSIPKSHLSIKENNIIFSENNENKELKNNEKNFRRSFTPRRRKKFKIAPENNTSNKKEENNKNIKNKITKEKESKDNEDNDINKKGAILKKGKSSPLEVICEQIEDEKKVLDTTRTFKNKDRNINDKNNNSIGNHIKTQKDLIFNDSKETNNNQNIQLNLLNNNSSYYSDKSDIVDNNVNDNNNKDNSLKKNEVGLHFNHTGSSRGEEEYKQEVVYNNNNNYNNNDNINYNKVYNNDNINYNNVYNNEVINDDNDLDDKEIKKYIKEIYKDVYKKKYYNYRNKYYKEFNWRNIKIDSLLFTKNEKDILLQGEFLVFNNILEINSMLKSKYSRYLTLTKHEINIFRSKEKYIYNNNPLINISLFNISKCDLLNKTDINLFINLKNLLLKYSFYIKLTTVTGMLIFEPTNNSNRKYRFSNPFLKSNVNKHKSHNKFTNKPKDIELIPEIKGKYKIKNNININNIQNEKNKNNDDINNKNLNKSGLYIIISSDDIELMLNFVAIINFLRK